MSSGTHFLIGWSEEKCNPKPYSRVKFTGRIEKIDFGQQWEYLLKLNFWTNNFSRVKSTPERVQYQPTDINIGTEGKYEIITIKYVLLLEMLKLFFVSFNKGIVLQNDILYYWNLFKNNVVTN